jgi:hypothetical protein
MKYYLAAVACESLWYFTLKLLGYNSRAAGDNEELRFLDSVFSSVCTNYMCARVCEDKVQQNITPTTTVWFTSMVFNSLSIDLKNPEARVLVVWCWSNVDYCWSTRVWNVEISNLITCVESSLKSNLVTLFWFES